MITGVVKYPGREPEEIISLQEAIDTGVIDPNNGLYIDRTNRQRLAIPQAMNEGYIKVTSKRITIL